MEKKQRWGNQKDPTSKVMKKVNAKHYTIGWTNCDCFIRSCKKCGIVIEYNEKTNKVKIYEKGILLQTMSPQDYCKSLGEKKILFPKMQGTMDESAKKKEQSSEIRRQNKKLERAYFSLEFQKEKIRNGTQIDNGENFRQTLEENRGSSSSKWQKRRQSSREFNSSGKGRTRFVDTQKEKATTNKMSLLWKDDDAFKYCPKCKTPLIEENKWISGVVLDCFMGSGTTGVVAKKLCRDFIGIELNSEYVEMATKRINSTPKPLLST